MNKDIFPYPRKIKKCKFTTEEIQKLIAVGCSQYYNRLTEDKQELIFNWGINLDDDEEYISKQIETTTKPHFFKVTTYTWRDICQTSIYKGIDDVIDHINWLKKLNNK